MSQEVFFINVFPTNDRRETVDYKTLTKNFVELSVRHGFRHTLMTVGNKRLDPWTLSQWAMHENPQFAPLIAVNPFYQHPVEIAKKVTALHQLYGHSLALNFVTGSFFSERKSVGDHLSFKESAQRLKESVSIVRELLEGTKPAISSGPFYPLQGAEVHPKCQGPRFECFLSGNLRQDFAGDEDCYFVTSMRPLAETLPAAPRSGISFGICARETREEARAALSRLYPADRRGEMLFELSLANNETPWNRWLKTYLAESKQEDPFYCLQPMKNFWSSVPYLVGSYDEVTQRIREYIAKGHGFFILDFLPEEADHVGEVMRRLRAGG